MTTFFKDAEGFEIFVLMKLVAFGEAVFGELVFDFARRTEIGSKNGDNA